MGAQFMNIDERILGGRTYLTRAGARAGCNVNFLRLFFVLYRASVVHQPGLPEAATYDYIYMRSSRSSTKSHQAVVSR